MHTKPSLYASYTVQLPYVNYTSQIFFFGTCNFVADIEGGT